MDFTIKKPAHIFSLLILIFTLIIVVILPIISYFSVPISTESIDTDNISESYWVFVEIFVLILQILIVAIGMFIVVPLLWYRVVNNYTFKEILSRIKLRKEGMDMAILWGFLTVIVMFAFLFIIGIFLTFYGVTLDDSSNITDLEQIFSLPSIFIVVALQPIGEEIFFRGFLLDKINAIYGRETALIATSILFGIAHLTYGNIYPAIMTGVLGLLLAYMVVKTKSLTTAIVAHILFNLLSVSLYIFGKSFIP